MTAYKEVVDAVTNDSPIAFTTSGKTPDGREYMVRVYDNGGISVEIDGLSYGKPAWKWWRIADSLSPLPD